ncbi:hypothetical protein MJN76_34335, partial [Salmonella enterica subsp. enterica serovar Anatum]|nr:hypothetical protein [Salmonella enterica subsp. enterica serovar Anatum]
MLPDKIYWAGVILRGRRGGRALSPAGFPSSGKYFEKLILGSLFTILGFEYEENLDENIDRKCFTLSLRSDDR